MIGKILGDRYEILEEIGNGGMAIVYKARCQKLNRVVAIKVLKSEYKADEEFVKKFNRESQAAASLSHPNIVSVYDVGHDNGNYYIVMELVEGINLKDYIKANPKMNWRTALKFSMQICSALTHAHRNGIIHRDIKPHNIILSKDGNCKVADFGIACATNMNETKKIDKAPGTGCVSGAFCCCAGEGNEGGRAPLRPPGTQEGNASPPAPPFCSGGVFVESGRTSRAYGR